MPRFAAASTADLAELVALAALRAAEGWSPNRRLLEIAHGASYSRIFVVRAAAGDLARGAQADRTVSADIAYGPAATALAISYGALGFIGNVLVHPTNRGRGLGHLVMRSAIAWLQQCGVAAIELDATRAGRPLYEQLGFVGGPHSWELAHPRQALLHAARRAMQASTDLAGVAIERLVASGLEEIAALDAAAFGGTRLDLIGRMVAAYGAETYVARGPDGGAKGYLVARVAESWELSADDVDDNGPALHLGPWVAQTPSIAAALLGTLLARGIGDDRMVYANVPGASAEAVLALNRWGVTLRQDDVRMRLDLATEARLRPKHTGRPEWVYAMLSAMVG